MIAAVSGERLNRFLARRGVASRRGADEMIAAGRVQVNGAAAQVGAIIDPNSDAVSVDGVAVGAPTRLVTLMLNKPRGVITTHRDTHGRRTVVDLVPEIAGLVTVGRLDAESRGLLLLTTDGELAHRLTHPRHGVQKTYLVRVQPAAGDDALRRLRAGVELEDGFARPVRVEQQAPGLLEITMGEGRKREVRRLCSAVALDVVDLQRIAEGPLRLGELAEGAVRELEPAELRDLYAAVGMEAPR